MTSLLTVKLRRDLRATWPRILAMVVAIAVSLTVFSAVLYVWSASARETSSAYLGTEPASATVVLDRGIAAEQMAAIAAGARTRPGCHRGDRAHPVHQRDPGRRPCAG